MLGQSTLIKQLVSFLLLDNLISQLGLCKLIDNPINQLDTCLFVDRLHLIKKLHFVGLFLLVDYMYID